jgi:hypothetical protein
MRSFWQPRRRDRSPSLAPSDRAHRKPLAAALTDEPSTILRGQRVMDAARRTLRRVRRIEHLAAEATVRRPRRFRLVARGRPRVLCPQHDLAALCARFGPNQRVVFRPQSPFSAIWVGDGRLARTANENESISAGLSRMPSACIDVVHVNAGRVDPAERAFRRTCPLRLLAVSVPGRRGFHIAGLDVLSFANGRRLLRVALLITLTGRLLRCHHPCPLGSSGPSRRNPFNSIPQRRSRRAPHCRG